jgi:hypothetical protein
MRRAARPTSSGDAAITSLLRDAPRMPLGHFELVPTLVLTAIAAAIFVMSWWRYRARDIGRWPDTAQSA